MALQSAKVNIEANLINLFAALSDCVHSTASDDASGHMSPAGDVPFREVSIPLGIRRVAVKRWRKGY